MTEETTPIQRNPGAARRSAARIRSLETDIRDVERDIDDQREKVRFAERMQWQTASNARHDGVGKSVAIIAIVQKIKSNARKEIRQMEQDRNKMEKEVENEEREQEQRREAEREAERQQEREHQRRQERERREREERERGDDRDMD